MNKTVDKWQNENCYESNSLQELCETNEKGEFVCNRLKQTWKHCPGKEKVLVASIKEEGIREELPQMAFPNVESLFNHFPMMNQMNSNVFENIFNFSLKNPDLRDMSNVKIWDEKDFVDPRSYKQPQNENNKNLFPEPQHWKK